MNIQKTTRISELIKANKECIEALAAVASPLAKLKNPVLRKLMAPRVTIEEAANMGGCSLQDLVRALRPLGFVYLDTDRGNISGTELSKPTWLECLEPAAIVHFDVREMLASGQDPLKEIMRQFKQLEAGKALCIVNTFEPVPLVRLLEKDNVKCYTEKPGDKLFHTYFYKIEKESREATMPEGGVITDSETDFASARARYPGEYTREIDVRALEMPGPMQDIL
jgi:uncharacterized protein (DUF2249 family)